MSYACPTCGALNRDAWAECVLCRSPRASAQPVKEFPPPEPESELPVPLIDLPRPPRPEVPYPPRAPTPHPRRWPGIARPTSHDSVRGMLERVTTWRWWEPPGEGALRLITAPAAVVLRWLGAEARPRVVWTLALRVPGHGLVAVELRGWQLAELPPAPAELYVEGAWRSVRRFEATRIARITARGAREWVATAWSRSPSRPFG